MGCTVYTTGIGTMCGQLLCGEFMWHAIHNAVFYCSTRHPSLLVCQGLHRTRSLTDTFTHNQWSESNPELLILYPPSFSLGHMSSGYIFCTYWALLFLGYRAGGRGRCYCSVPHEQLLDISRLERQSSASHQSAEKGTCCNTEYFGNEIHQI